MVIYADMLFLTNLYIDFFLLICAKKFLKLHSSSLRLLLGAFIGAVYSLTALLPKQSLPVNLPLSLLSALAMALAAFSPCKRQLILKAALVFYLFSFLFAGFFMLVYTAFPAGRVALRNGLVYFDISPVSLFLCTLAAYLATSLFRRIFASADHRTMYQSFLVTHQGVRVKLFAKADTGNGLREPFSGLPVLIAEEEILRPLLPEQIRRYLSDLKNAGDNGGSADIPVPENALRLVPFSSMGGRGILPAFRPDRIVTARENQPVNCYLAVFPGKLSAGQFNALFHPEILPAAPKTVGSAHTRNFLQKIE